MTLFVAFAPPQRLRIAIFASTPKNPVESTLPEMILRSAGFVPPIVLPDESVITTPMPGDRGPCELVPVVSVPMKLPEIILLPAVEDAAAELTTIPASTKRLMTKPLIVLPPPPALILNPALLKSLPVFAPEFVPSSSISSTALSASPNAFEFALDNGCV